MGEDNSRQADQSLFEDPGAAFARVYRKAMNRRRFMGIAGAYLAGAVGIDAVLNACAPGSSSSSSNQSTSSTAKPGGIKVINFFTTEDDPATQDALKAAIADYESKNTDTHISFILISGDERDERARTGLSVGQDLGIFEVDRSYSPAFVRAGYLHQLDSLINAVGADQFVVGSRQQIDGHDWVFPYGAGPFCLWYRTDLMSAPKTVSDVKAAAKDHTGGGKYGISLAVGDTGAVYDTLPQFIFANGGDYWDTKGNVVYGSDAVRQAIQDCVDLLHYAPPGNTNWSPFKFITNFISGLTAMSPWAGRLGVNAWAQKSPYEKVANVVRPPYNPSNVGLVRWSNLAVDKKTAYPDDALKFMQFLFTGDWGVKYANSVPGQLVPSIKSTRDAAINDKSNGFVQAHPDWVATLYNQTPYGTDLGGPMGATSSGTLKLYNGPGAPWSQTAFGAKNVDMQMLQKIMLQNMSVKDAHAWAVDTYKGIVKDYKSKNPNWKPPANAA